MSDFYTMNGEKDDKLRCESWNPACNTFVIKAQQNFIFAEIARKQGRYDIEANRIYYALHQLACELVRKKVMVVKHPGDRATKAEPWRIKHGSYGSEIRATLNYNDADKIFSQWQSFRVIADYEPGQISLTEQWKYKIQSFREQAYEVAEVIYEKLSK